MSIMTDKVKLIFVESKAKFFSIVVAMVKNINEAIDKKNKTWYV
jgi:hypothetical protein